MSPKKRGGVTLLLLSPALLAISGCSRTNCDSTFSTPQTSDDCGPGTRSRSGSGFIGGVRSGSGMQSGSSSVRGGFGSSGSSSSGGFFGGGG